MCGLGSIYTPVVLAFAYPEYSAEYPTTYLLVQPVSAFGCFRRHGAYNRLLFYPYRSPWRRYRFRHLQYHFLLTDRVVLICRFVVPDALHRILLSLCSQVGYRWQNTRFSQGFLPAKQFIRRLHVAQRPHRPLGQDIVT